MFGRSFISIEEETWEETDLSVQQPTRSRWKKKDASRNETLKSMIVIGESCRVLHPQQRLTWEIQVFMCRYARNCRFQITQTHQPFTPFCLITIRLRDWGEEEAVKEWTVAWKRRCFGMKRRRGRQIFTCEHIFTVRFTRWYITTDGAVKVAFEKFSFSILRQISQRVLEKKKAKYRLVINHTTRQNSQDRNVWVKRQSMITVSDEETVMKRKNIISSECKSSFRDLEEKRQEVRLGKTNPFCLPLIISCDHLLLVFIWWFEKKEAQRRTFFESSTGAKR